MAINVHGLRLILRGHKLGVNFEKSAMLGRQRINMSVSQLCDIVLREFGMDVDEAELRRIYQERYADDLLKLLGAAEVESFDNSDWEGATVVHDFNQPMPDRYKDRYTVLIDGGTLEHIFNFPVAIGNCMEALQVSGTYFGITPANNYFGHGFYQFSPELFYRVLSENNGFRVENMYLHEGRDARHWFSVPDPDTVQSRVTLRNIEPTELLIQARKLEHRSLFAAVPQQSDYVAQWREVSGSAGRASKSLKPTIGLSRLVAWTKRLVTRFVGARRNRLYEQVPLERLGSQGLSVRQEHR